MAKRPAYTPEFRHRLVELVRAGRPVLAVAKEFDVSRQAIVNWLKQEDLDSGKRTDGLTTEEHKELVKLRRRVRELEMEKEILKKAAAWFARETHTIPENSSD